MQEKNLPRRMGPFRDELKVFAAKLDTSGFYHGSDGSIFAFSQPLGDSWTAVAVDTSLPADTPAIGMRMPDGTVYAGPAPDGRCLFVAESDTSRSINLNDAFDYASTANIHGHSDWRAPEQDELNVLFSNATAIGGFTEGWYWSRTQTTNFSACAQRFSDGRKAQMGADMKLALRLVRS